MAKTEFLILCDHAEAVNGKLYVMGAGWTTLLRAPVSARSQPDQPTSPPSPSRFAIAASFLVDWADANDATPFRISLEDEDRRQVHLQAGGELRPGRAPLATKGSPVRTVLAIPVLMAFPNAGGYCVAAQVAGQPETVVTFEVADPPTLGPTLSSAPLPPLPME